MNSVLRKTLSSPLLLLGILVVLSLLALSLFAPMIADKNGINPNLDFHLSSPSLKHPFGFGVNGISVFSWIIFGIKNSLLVSLLTTFFTVILGGFLGILAGYYSGILDAILMKITDIVLAFPGFLLALYLASVMPPSIFSLIFALSAMGWVSYARLIRALVYEKKSEDFVTSALAMGASDSRIIFHHILPNILSPIFVQISYGMSVVILAEAGLTFLGIGLPLGTPSLGALLDQGVANLFHASYLAIYPGAVIALSILGFNFVGDGLRDLLDPKK